MLGIFFLWRKVGTCGKIKDKIFVVEGDGLSNEKEKAMYS